jgi:dihydrofolate reductase
MPKLRVHNFAISLDGYAAGPDQDIDNPLGRRGLELHEWVFATRFWHRLEGKEGGEEGPDDRYLSEADNGIGATIMGRNMFGPLRGPWKDQAWKGWWGDNPPYHHPVFVLTHHAREPIAMEGGTTFNFVTDGIEAALRRAFDAAGGKDVRLGGGAGTIQQYLRARLVDEIGLAIVPVLLGSGERLFDHLDGGPAGYRCIELVSSPAVVHVRLVRN